MICGQIIHEPSCHSRYHPREASASCKPTILLMSAIAVMSRLALGKHKQRAGVELDLSDRVVYLAFS